MANATPKRSAVGSTSRTTGVSTVDRLTVNKSEDICVMCRVRPVMKDESQIECVKVIPPNSITVSAQESTSAPTFSFDQVFDKNATQEQVFDKIGRSVVDCVLAGFNSTVFAYGQTGAGKTHTMVGSDEDPGFIPRFARELFRRVDDSPSSVEYSVQVQYVEIYLERVRDLLEERSSAKQQQLTKQNLQIREDATYGVHIPDATSQYVCDSEELLKVCVVARDHRATSETLMNSESSRSHSVMLITLTQKDVNTGATKTSKINLVDLAGSEAVKRSGAEGERLTEAQAINSSLSALGNVIHALTSDKATYVPYRDSKLTRLLQESLGGNAKTWLVVNVSPSAANISETISTLRFGQRAKAVKNKAVVNQIRSAQELENALKLAEERIREQDAVIYLLRNGSAGGSSDNANGNSLDELEATHREEISKLQQKIFAIEKERDDAREGWERSREAAALAESEMQKEIAVLKDELERSLTKITELELQSPISHPPTATTPTKSKPEDTSQTQGPPTTASNHKKLPSELRLEQLVQVHRQLLRKYAQLELVVNEARQAMALGEDRIRILTKELAAAKDSPGHSNISPRLHARMAKGIRGGNGSQVAS